MYDEIDDKEKEAIKRKMALAEQLCAKTYSRIAELREKLDSLEDAHSRYVKTYEECQLRLTRVMRIPFGVSKKGQERNTAKTIRALSESERQDLLKALEGKLSKTD